MPGLYIRAPEVSLRIFTAPRQTVFLARVHDVRAFFNSTSRDNLIRAPPSNVSAFKQVVKSWRGLQTSRALAILSAILNM